MKKQRRGRHKIILGLTGSFGSGKSTVAGIFRSYGAKVIDADRIAHALIRPGTEIYKKIVGTFGKGILKKGMAVDRAKLGHIVFSDKNLLKKLNRIMHPGIIRVIRKEIKAAAGGIIVLDAPLLIEAQLGRIADKLVVVKATKEKQIERIRKKTGLSRQDILKRIATQVPLRDKVRLADFVIDNSQRMRQTKKQVLEIRRLLWRN